MRHVYPTHHTPHVYDIGLCREGELVDQRSSFIQNVLCGRHRDAVLYCTVHTQGLDCKSTVISHYTKKALITTAVHKECAKEEGGREGDASMRNVNHTERERTMVEVSLRDGKGKGISCEQDVPGTRVEG